MSEARPYSDTPLSAADSGQDKVTEGGSLAIRVGIDIRFAHQLSGKPAGGIPTPVSLDKHCGEFLI